MCFESRTDRKHRPRVDLGVGWDGGRVSVSLWPLAPGLPSLPWCLDSLPDDWPLCPFQEPSRAFWKQPVVWETLLLGSSPTSLPTPGPPPRHWTPRALKPWRGREEGSGVGGSLRLGGPGHKRGCAAPLRGASQSPDPQPSVGCPIPTVHSLDAAPGPASPAWLPDQPPTSG